MDSTEKKDTLSENDVEKECKRLSDVAVKCSRIFGEELDYSNESINTLEDMLEYYHSCVEESLLEEDKIVSMAWIFGAYLGETMLRNKLTQCGFEWQYEEEVPCIKHKTNDWAARPISKVYKRLVNGEEDNVVSFYDMGLEDWD